MIPLLLSIIFSIDVSVFLSLAPFLLSELSGQRCISMDEPNNTNGWTLGYILLCLSLPPLLAVRNHAAGRGTIG